MKTNSIEKTEVANPFSETPLKFSIITPCYGEDWKTLKQCVEATIDSNYTNLEIIVVFDGPNKKGEKVMEQLIKDNPEVSIRYFIIKHAGAPSARNYGASKATGDIYSFLDADSYLYPETLQIWANAFEEHPEVNRVWGLKEYKTAQGNFVIGGNVPMKPSNQPNYWAFRFQNFCDSAQPLRASAFPGWDPELKSLQDWDLALRMLEKTNYEGTDWLFIRRPFYITESTKVGGISDDSHKNWLERLRTVKAKHNIPLSDICVVSHGAAHHGINVAKMLKADYNAMPSFKAHDYKLIYLVGFYTGGDPRATGSHMEVFGQPGEVTHDKDGFSIINKYTKAKKLIHWIGTDVLNMHISNSYQKNKAIKEWMKKEGVINWSEFKPTHDELLEVGIKSEIVPMPPKKLYSPMPLPEEFTIGIYENEHSKMYKEALMEEVARTMPDVKFYFFGDESKKGQKTENTEHLGVINMEEWMPKLSCCLRITIHDGLPLSPVEFMMAGRQVVTNIKLTGAIEVKAEVKSIIEGLRQAQTTPLKPWVGKYWRKTLDQQKFIKRVYKLIK